MKERDDFGLELEGWIQKSSPLLTAS
jgi:hypothetical protein